MQPRLLERPFVTRLSFRLTPLPFLRGAIERAERLGYLRSVKYINHTPMVQGIGFWTPDKSSSQTFQQKDIWHIDSLCFNHNGGPIHFYSSHEGWKVHFSNNKTVFGPWQCKNRTEQGELYCLDCRTKMAVKRQKAVAKTTDHS